MNYAKVVGAALQLFPKKIKVTLIDAVSGNNLGKFRIHSEQLPVAFNRPTTIEINNINWRVLQANPTLADDFLFTKKLTLQVQNSASLDMRQFGFSLPTICGNLPSIGTPSLYHDFTLDLTEFDWRQIEFSPLSQSVIVEETLKTIEIMLSSQPNPLLGYEQQHVREDTSLSTLDIPWEGFCSLLTNPVYGNISFSNKGFIQQGFVVRSDSHIYYGILENGSIRILCLNQFDWADDELMRILSTYSLSLVDWCNASCISAEDGEEPKNEFLDL